MGKEIVICIYYLLLGLDMSEEEDPDVIRIVSSIFTEIFATFDLPVCIGIIDGQTGRVITQEGDCPDIGLFEGQCASLIQAFGEVQSRFESSFGETLNLITIEFLGLAYYVDNLLNTRANLFLIAQSSFPDLLNKARPFLVNIVQKIELMFEVATINAADNKP